MEDAQSGLKSSLNVLQVDEDEDQRKHSTNIDVGSPNGAMSAARLKPLNDGERRGDAVLGCEG